MSNEPIEFERWVCTCCGYVYDSEIGDPEHGVPPGTAFADLPSTWTCPLCLALKKAFEKC